ncbi:hypothetical protein ACLMAJ_36655 [Nocardia sp. KC 131]|uniref:hypothetical protein n=1 Tax=Nocardia arseniciresistens TaxID=3392119 RepID=UPI00398E3A5A
MTTKNNQHDPFDLIGLAVLNTVWSTMLGIGVAVWWAVLFPMVSIPLLAAAAVGVVLGWVWGVVVVGVSISGMVLWRRRSPQTFEQWITSRARTRCFTWFRYRRRWAKLLTACNLTIAREDRTFVPRLLSVEIGETVDRLKVRMLEGHCPADWENRTDHLTHAFRAQECRTSIIGPGLVQLVFRRSDSLAETVALPRIDGGQRWGKEAA